ncbi:unnamed protein product [Brassica rapa]|nr:unnamed protein product [Brassica rapa]VDC64574.1 unnamed protein product [Brassica rapa]
MVIATSSSSASSGSCRSDLERRIGLQLDQTILEDVLIPSNPNGVNNTMSDIDSILRIFSIFLNLDEEDDDEEEDRHHRNRFGDETEMVFDDFDSPGSPKQSSVLKVSKLIALDTNLTTSKFIALAESSYLIMLVSSVMVYIEPLTFTSTHLRA